MTLEKLKPGMVVYDVGSYTMGNTHIRSVAVRPVRIVEVDLESQTVEASWNFNPPRRFYSRQWSKWRLERPVLISKGIGHRLATRAELKAMRAEAEKTNPVKP